MVCWVYHINNDEKISCLWGRHHEMEIVEDFPRARSGLDALWLLGSMCFNVQTCLGGLNHDWRSYVSSGFKSPTKSNNDGTYFWSLEIHHWLFFWWEHHSAQNFSKFSSLSPNNVALLCQWHPQNIHKLSSCHVSQDPFAGSPGHQPYRDTTSRCLDLGEIQVGRSPNVFFPCHPLRWAWAEWRQLHRATNTVEISDFPLLMDYHGLSSFSL